MTPLPIHFAPLQGYTGDVYRRIHHRLLGGISNYYTPFLRMEGGGVRSKDIRDIHPEFNQGVPVIPQIIAKNMKEFDFLTQPVEERGINTLTSTWAVHSLCKPSTDVAQAYWLM